MYKPNFSVKIKKEHFLYGFMAFLFIWCCVLCARVRVNAEKAKYVYVYNMELLVKNYPAILSLQQNYEKQLAILTAQVEEVKAKVEKVEDKKAKEEVSKAYLSQIVEKRNNLVASYQQNLQILTANMNKALQEVTAEKKINTVFNISAIAVTTPYVVDITKEVLQKLK